MLGIILWVKCLEESCQHRAAISMQIRACGEKCNWSNYCTDGTPPSHSTGVWKHEGRDLSVCSASARAKHKRLLCCKGGLRHTAAQWQGLHRNEKLCSPPSQWDCKNKGSVFQKESEKQSQGIYVLWNKKGWLTMWSLQRKIIIIYSTWLIPGVTVFQSTHLNSNGLWPRWGSDGYSGAEFKTHRLFWSLPLTIKMNWGKLQ